MERVADQRLKALRDSGKEIYSISKLDSINNCLYGAYRTYILHDRGGNNIYALMGTKIHDCLEKIANGEAVESDLLPALQSELDDMDMLGITFPKDSKGGDAIREGWITDMTHFCETYKHPKGEFTTEELFIYKTSEDNYLQGYIDLQKKVGDNKINIYDYKTSTLYKGSDLEDHGRQLCVYLMGKEQEGFDVGGAAWIFLKYVDIEFMGKKTVKSKEKTKLQKTVERKKIASEMSKYVEQDLAEAGYDDVDIEVMIMEFKESNSFEVLPEEVRNNYKIKPCVLSYEITDEVKKECEDYINNTVKMWKALGGKDHVEDYPPRKFTKVQKNGKEVEDIFFCTQLCGHFNNCPYIQDYLATKNDASEDDDLF